MRNAIPIICLVIFFVGTIPLLIFSNKTDECYKHMPVNISTTVSRIFNNCYVMYSECYQTKKTCGTLGISCYEASESHTRCYPVSVCYDINTGEIC